MSPSRVHTHEGYRDGGLPLLIDGCEACAEHVEMGGLALDQERFRRAWETMVAVEHHDYMSGGYLSKLDKELGTILYRMALLMERNMGIDPWRWPPSPAGAAASPMLPPCAVCGKPWEEHYAPGQLKYKMGPYGTYGLTADHTPHIPGVHAPRDAGHRPDWTAGRIAAALLEGAEAKIVGGGSGLAGARLAFMEVDGLGVKVAQPRSEAPGVRVTLQDGSVHLYATTDRGRAQEVLNRAREIATAHRRTAS